MSGDWRFLFVAYLISFWVVAIVVMLIIFSLPWRMPWSRKKRGPDDYG
jgi:hypothetical protein